MLHNQRIQRWGWAAESLLQNRQHRLCCLRNSVQHESHIAQRQNGVGRNESGITVTTFWNIESVGDAGQESLDTVLVNSLTWLEYPESILANSNFASTWDFFFATASREKTLAITVYSIRKWPITRLIFGRRGERYLCSNFKIYNFVSCTKCPFLVFLSSLFLATNPWFQVEKWHWLAKKLSVLRKCFQTLWDFKHHDEIYPKVLSRRT